MRSVPAMSSQAAVQGLAIWIVSSEMLRLDMACLTRLMSSSSLSDEPHARKVHSRGGPGVPGCPAEDRSTHNATRRGWRCALAERTVQRLLVELDLAHLDGLLAVLLGD